MIDVTRSHLKQGWRLLEPFVALLVVLLLFALSPVSDKMLSGGSWSLILLHTVIVALGAMGMTLIIVSGGIDLSAGSVIALSGVVGARCIQHGLSLPAVIIFTVLTGALVGAVNGFFVAGLRMMPFIVTLGMMGIARGVAKWVADEETVNYAGEYPDHAIQQLMMRESARDFLPLPFGVWITSGLAVAMVIVMRKTVFGRHVFAIGSNEATARLCGIRVQRNKLAIYTVGGLFFGLAGLMQLSRLNLGDPTAAVGLELEIIAAVVIGGASLNGGAGSILGSMLGALIMAILKNWSTWMSGIPLPEGWPKWLKFQNYTQEIMIGLVIILAVFVDQWRQRRQT